MQFILALQTFFIFLIFVSNLICVFLPLYYVTADSARGKNPLIIVLCNSLSAGVFLGTCYLQLVPYVETKYAEVFNKAHYDSDFCNLTAQCMIMLGFFIIVMTEQVALALRKPKAATAIAETVAQPKKVTMTGDSAKSSDYDASSDVSGTDSGTDERRKMLKKHRKPNKSTNSGSLSFAMNGNNSNSGQGKDDHEEDHGHGHGGGHGHDGGHGHSHMIEISSDHSAFRCILLLIALSAHSLFEGMAVGLQDSIGNLVNLFIGVFIHECLVAFAVGISLARQSLNRSMLAKLGLAFSLMIPVGMLLGLFIGQFHGIVAELIIVSIQAIAAGTFVYVIFLEVIPVEINAQDHKMLRFLFVFIGFVLILLLVIGLHNH